jgi:hypothetical protein
VQAVVISTAAAVCQTTVVDVAVVPALGTTTATCTSTVPPADGPLGAGLTEPVEERAAVLEFDGGHDRETADRLAREMVLGRDAAPDSLPADDIVVGVDHAGLAARSNPYVRQVLGQFTGTARLIDDRGDPFAGRRRQSHPPQPGVCRCGQDDWVQVPIHGGRSTRVDCRNCDRFGWFAVWHGRRLRGPDDAAGGATGELKVPDVESLSFTAATMVPSC